MEEVTDTQEVVYREALVESALGIFADKNQQLIQLLPSYSVTSDSPQDVPAIEPENQELVSTSTTPMASSTESEMLPEEDSVASTTATSSESLPAEDSTPTQPDTGTATPAI